MQLIQAFVQLPDEVRATLTGLVIAGVAILFNLAIAHFPFLEFLRKYQAEWSLSLATGLIVWLENLIPDRLGDVAIKGIAFLLAVIALYVPYALVRRKFVATGHPGFIQG